MAQRQKPIAAYWKMDSAIRMLSGYVVILTCFIYSDELIAKEFELDEQEAINKCCEMALQSAAFSAAVTNNTYRAFYVFEFLIDEEYGIS